MITKYQRRMLENIYDLIKECALSKKQDDWWAELSHKHAKEAKSELHDFTRMKNMEWDGDKNEIKIGEHFVLKLEIR